MDGVKGLLASKTFWGGLIAVATGIGGFFGYAISAEDQVSLVNLGFAASSGVGGLLAIFGRIVASKKIGSASEKAA